MNFFSEYVLVVLSFISSFIITYISIPSIIKVAELKNLQIIPNERSAHSRNIPTLGGLAIFAGVSITVLIFVDSFQLQELKYILAATVVMFFIGIKDDILVIAPITKMIGQIVAASIVVILGDMRITSFHGFFNIHELNYYLSISLSVFAIISIINSLNLIDGIDGLCASVGILTTFTLGIWFFLAGNFQMAILATSLVGALIAFLRFNFSSNNNKIFMGDTGSLILGLLLSILVIEFNEKNLNVKQDYFIQASPAVSFAILIIPIFDMLRVMFIRFFLRKPILQPDKRHIHHKFLEFGFSHKKIVVILMLMNLAFIIFSFYLSQYLSIRRLLLVIFLVAIFVFYIPTYLSQKKSRKKL